MRLSECIFSSVSIVFFCEREKRTYSAWSRTFGFTLTILGVVWFLLPQFSLSSRSRGILFQKVVLTKIYTLDALQAARIIFKLK